MLVIFLSILAFHIVCLLAGEKVAAAFVRNIQVDPEISNVEQELEFQKCDPIFLCVCIVSSVLITTAAIGYNALAIEIADDDTPARALLGLAIPWAYGFYGVVVLPIWMLFVGWGIDRKMKVLIFISMITAVLVAWSVWHFILSEVTWFPGA